MQLQQHTNKSNSRVSNSQSQPDPQSIQTAINACDRSHTEIHRAIAALKRGETIEAKRLMSHSITGNVIDLLLG